MDGMAGDLMAGEPAAAGIATLAKGLLIGLSIAAPVGPIGLLCIRRTLSDGRGAGLATGLGAASADAVYGAVAGFGLAAVSNLLLGWEEALRLFGGAMLLWLGVATLRARPPAEAAPVPGPAVAGWLGAYATTFALTLANPATVVSFVAVFGALGLTGGAGGTGAAAVLVAGVFAGSALWWLGLSTGVAAVRHRVTAGAMLWINRVSGAILAGFGAAALASLMPWS